jgi:hypothetical protein
MNQIDVAICNLEHTRDALLRIADNDKNYNTEWGNMLNIMGWSLHKHAQELKEQIYVYGMEGVENV